MNMHIAIDARMHGTAQRGIGRYLMKLIEHLEIVDKENTYTIFLCRANWEEYQPHNPNFKKALWDAPWYGIREQLSFRQLFSVTNSPSARVTDSNYAQQVTRSKLPITIYHFPHWNVPLLFRRPFIVTIHDLELFSSNRTRENTTRGRFVYWLKHLAFRMVFRHAVLASRAIIVPSNTVREQLLDKYPQARKKVQVIYEAPTMSTDIRNSKLDIGNSRISNIQYPISEHFALYVGSAYPHKNLPRLIEAWQSVHQELPGYKLVLVGCEDFFWKKLKKSWPHNPSQPPLILRGGDRSEPPLKLRGGRGSYETNSIVFYGSATDEELTALYKNASLLIQPSLEEGFSLSPLEALAHGCPVAVSDIPVHREILENAAFYFDPRDTHTIATTIKAALTHIEARKHTVARGQELLAGYSWITHAKETLAVYLKEKDLAPKVAQG